MLSNYFKTAIRHILHHRGYAIINITGLAVGLAVFILTASFVDFHLSFDEFHKDADQIFSVVQVLSSDIKGEHHTAKIPAPLLDAFRGEIPEITGGLRWIQTGRWVIRHEGQKYYAEESTVWAVDANFFSFFSFELTAGDPKSALAEPQSIVLTRTAALKYFGEENPLGRKLTLGNFPAFVVTGVARDAPLNSSLPFDSLISLNSFGWQNDWSTNCAAFVKLAAGTDPGALKKKLFGLFQKHASKLSVSPVDIYLQPFSQLYLESAHIKGLWRQQSRITIYMTLIIGIVLLAVVCFNFINLATTQYLTRTKEVGVRKVVGGNQRQLRWQFLGESVLLALIAYPPALVFYEVARPLFIFMIAQGPGRAYPGLWDNPQLFIESVGVAVLVGILAGCYPAVFLSRLNPVQILRGGMLAGKKGTRLRQVLVISQFVASLLAVLVALFTFNYYAYLSKLDLGFEKDNVLLVDLGRNYHNALLKPIKEDLKRHPDIEAVAAATWIPVNWNSELQVAQETLSGQKNMTMNAYGVDYDFVELLKIKIIEGRSFSLRESDGANYMINTSAAKKLGWKYPIGKKLTVRGKQGTIIGVVEDFHFKTLYADISPSILYLNFNYLNVLYIKVSGQSLSRVFNFIDNRLQFFEPDLPVSYSLLTQRLNDVLLGTKKWAFLAGSIGLIAILFSCLGLLSLASHAAQTRAKEIGIRKAHGATAAQIIRELLMYFVRLIVIAILIAFPAFYIIDKMATPNLFASTADTGFIPYAYLCSGLLALISGLVAVILQTVKVARANPVDSLRYE